MNAEQHSNYLAALLSSLTINVLIPGVMLCGLVIMFLWVLWRAQAADDFDVSQFLRAEDGRLSSVRLFAFVALAVSTWVIATDTINARLSHDNFLAYLVTWSGSLVLARAVDKWDGRLPLAKGPDT